MKTVTIEIPDDCEVQIVRKEESKGNKDAKKVLKEVFNIEVSPVIRTYQDLIDNDIELHGFYITNQSWINHINGRALNSNKLIATSEKVAKSMLAMAQISQLMPYYGGAITDEEWKATNWTTKYTIDRVEGSIVEDSWSTKYHFLAFHTKEQRDEFLKYNKQLVKDYLMIY